MHLKASAERRRAAYACLKPRDRHPHRARRMSTRAESGCRPSLKTARNRLPRVRAAPRNVNRNCINWPSFTLSLVRAALLSSGHPLHLPLLLAHLQRRLRQRIRLGLDCGFYLRANSTFLYTISDPRNVRDDIHDPHNDFISLDTDDTPLAESSSLDDARWYRVRPSSSGGVTLTSAACRAQHRYV